MYVPKHREEYLSKARRGSGLSAKALNKRSNVYHQSALRQIVFLSVGMYFSSLNFLYDAASAASDVFSSYIDDNEFDFTAGNNVENFFLMRKFLFDMIKYTSEFHNATIGWFFILIFSGSVGLLLLSFLRMDVHLSVYMLLGSIVALLTATLLKTLLDSVKINNEFHHFVVKDLNVIICYQEVELNRMIVNGDDGVMRRRQIVNDLKANLKLMERNPLLPGTILGIEIKREIIFKGLIAIVASCASAILRLGLE
ncbi:hypothetical protein TrCOL_g2691 [Triparma columacea]|uniref:Uncharacterized protein n=1 Tax=Triparma columacea TaxID=722753 RepID=A0A9W7GHM1_9STRA|nr:hypothetical protein TrCOL_g2691 [Triparma columacea]